MNSGLKGKARLAQLERIYNLLRPYRGRVFAASIALILNSAISFAYPQAARYAIDLGLSHRSLRELNWLAAISLLIFIVHSFFIWLRHYLTSWLGQKVVSELRIQVFEKLIHLSPSWFQERRSGEIVSRLAGDVSIIEGVVSGELSLALRHSVVLIGGLIILFCENIFLTISMLLVIPPLSISLLYFGRRIREMSRRVQDQLSIAGGRVQENLAAIQTVQAFTQEESQFRFYQREISNYFREALSLSLWRSVFMASASLGGFVSTIIVVWLGARAVVEGQLSGGELAAFLIYTFMVANSLSELGNLWGSLERAAGATDRLYAIVESVPEIVDKPIALDLPNRGGELEFQNISFSYPDRMQSEVLKDLSFQVHPGESVAFVGPSGAGKSTIVQLILRFFTPETGRILFEGIDISDLRLHDLRHAVAVVPQEPILFSGTIRDNISFGKENASLDQIEEAAARAQLDEFIRLLPHHYETEVGERGIKLSGGQRQRLAIARAIIRNPRLLILDEATSHLDPQNEALVQNAIRELMKDRTTLLIAHRLSTVREVDRILVLQNGEIVEEGSHAELIKQNGLYQSLVQYQMI